MLVDAGVSGGKRTEFLRLVVRGFKWGVKAYRIVNAFGFHVVHHRVLHLLKFSLIHSDIILNHFIDFITDIDSRLAFVVNLLTRNVLLSLSKLLLLELLQ